MPRSLPDRQVRKIFELLDTVFDQFSSEPRNLYYTVVQRYTFFYVAGVMSCIKQRFSKRNAADGRLAAACHSGGPQIRDRSVGFFEYIQLKNITIVHAMHLLVDH